MTTPRQWGIGTRSVHAGEAPDPTTGAHGVPIYQNATYAFHGYADLEAALSGRRPHFFYARDGNPTVRCLEVKLADLAEAEDAVCTASGMAALTTTLLQFAAGGGQIVAADHLYSITRLALAEDLVAAGARVTFVDVADRAAVGVALGDGGAVLLVETFSNPDLRVADLPALAALAHERGARLVVDNTFLSPALCRPLAHGADLVIESATKYLSGHGTTLGGVVAGPRALVAPIREKLTRLGGVLDPFAAWLLLSGVKTLPLRMAQHSANALRLAHLLVGHPAVVALNYPGLPGDPGHGTARRLLGDGGGFGGMISFRLRGGEAALASFLGALKLPTLAVSLGECSTLIWPFPDGLLRLSVGIEDGDDLVADFTAALAVVP